MHESFYDFYVQSVDNGFLEYNNVPLDFKIFILNKSIAKCRIPESFGEWEFNNKILRNFVYFLKEQKGKDVSEHKKMYDSIIYNFVDRWIYNIKNWY